MDPRTLTRALAAAALAAAGTLAAAAPAAAQGGDRQLLRSGSGDPYVLILFDTSGSMNWSPKCSAEQVAAGICDFLCETGDCPVPRDGDDPASKFRQAKEALYEVLRIVDDPIQFGFASFNQDRLGVQQKHWLYRAQSGQPFVTLAGGFQWPGDGAEEVFGELIPCDRGTGDAEIGCFADRDRAADVTDAWELTRVRRLPRLDANGSTAVAFYVRDGGQVYYVLTDDGAGAQTLGAPTITLRSDVYRCTGSPAANPSNGCNSNGERELWGSVDVVYDRVGDFTMWDFGVSRNPEQGGWFGVQDHTATGTCAGWDPNDDTPADRYPNDAGYLLRQTTGAPFFNPSDPDDTWMFRPGDVIPLDWTADHKLDVMNRLAPRLAGGDPALDPEAFAIANYLNDVPTAGGYLTLRNEGLRPLLPNGSTPLGHSLAKVRTWFRGCENGSCPADLGWDDYAAVNDPDWECRRKYLLVITDGDDTCPGRDPCSFTASMHALDDITTFVFAFGVENTAGNKLNCMAANGGSGDPIYAQNKQELVDALLAAFQRIREETVAFASAAVPSVQANVADKVYLSSFTPLNDASVWPGRLDAFLKPLPLDDNNLPDRTGLCVPGSVEAECFAWDAGDSQPAFDGETGYSPRGLLLQAPLESDLSGFDNTRLQLGLGEDERRVYFGVPAAPEDNPYKRQLFRYPITDGELSNYEFVWNLSTDPASDPLNRDIVKSVVDYTLAEKRGLIDNPDDPDNPFHIQYVMGDIFHANPLVLNAPADFDLYTKDLYWNTPLCGETLAATQGRGNQISYAWFANKHLCRRIMLFAGSDDGQLHAFDGGIFEGNECKLQLPVTFAGNGDDIPGRDPQLADDDPVDGEYGFGTGRELFAFIPEAMMPVVKELSEVSSLTSQYGVDNTPRVGDVFIDPVRDASGNPTCTEREWRTVLLGSYREGGPGIFALDITQPDVIPVGTNIPDPLGAGPTSYVPSCANGGTDCKQTSQGREMAFPALLWEFQDTTDEDGSGLADLGESWSTPVIGRIQVCNGACDAADEPEDRYVAVFGGGITESPTNSAADQVGNWLYMVDIETGRILYKRGGVDPDPTDSTPVGITGSIAADVTVLDKDVDFLIDTIYFGTTAGLVYKLDLGDGPFELGVDGRIQDPTGDARRFDPFLVFSTGGKPIYLEVTAVWVPQLRGYGLLFGTGNRWNLWDFTNLNGRFYALVDNGWSDSAGGVHDGMIDALGCSNCTQPLTEAVVEAIDPDAAFASTDPNLLFGNPDPDAKLPGWLFTLQPNEKLITEAVSIGGITVFTVFHPTSLSTGDDEDIECAKGGESKIFIVNTVNATGYAFASGATEFTRYFTAPKFTTQPFSESSATQNTGGEPGNNADQWTDELRRINGELKKLLPSTCRFANYSIDLKTIRSDTGLVFIAPVPICIEGHNWKEF